MNFLKALFLLTILLLSIPSNDGHDLFGYKNPEQASSLRGSSRLLASSRGMTCNKYPRICRVKGSPGPDCCKKKCVNVTTDRFNCGKCGRRCKYSELCCKGECVNPMFNKKHCGGCNNKCKKGNKCVYGMCNYA